MFTVEERDRVREHVLERARRRAGCRGGRGRLPCPRRMGPLVLVVDSVSEKTGAYSLKVD